MLNEKKYLRIIKKSKPFTKISLKAQYGDLDNFPHLDTLEGLAMPRKRLLPLFLFAALPLISTEPPPAYVTVSGGTSFIEQIDLNNGAPKVVASITGGAGLKPIAVTNNNMAYVTGGNTNEIYQVNLISGANTSLAIPGDPGLDGIALANLNTAYVVGFNTNNIIQVDLKNGANRIVTPVSGTTLLNAIALSIDNAAFAINNTSIFLVDLSNGANSLASIVQGSTDLVDIALADPDTAYLVDNFNQNLYLVDLPSGVSSIVTTMPVPPTGIALSDTNTAYVAGSDNNVYQVDLTTGVFTIVNTITGAGLLNGIGFPGIPTGGLTGNNLSLANYLNANAIPIAHFFSLFPSSATLDQALKSIAPTRNAYSTFMAQNAALSLSQLLTDHLRQRTFQSLVYQTNGQTVANAYPLNPNRLLADSDDACCLPDPCGCKRYTGWLGGFGEYAHQRRQNQTPAFSAGLGGVAAGIDYHGVSSNLVGGGGALAYTHLNEKGRVGYADVSQGFLTFYGSVNKCNWHMDFALWGGYYHVNNFRNISVPFFSGVAKSDVNGWQFVPHIEIGDDRFKWESCWFGFEPFVMADLVNSWELSFNEHGAVSFNMGQKGRYACLVRGEAGFRLHEKIDFCWGQLVFLEKGSYAYRKTFGTGTITAFLVGSPGTFTVETLTNGQSVGVGEFSLLFVPNGSSPYVNLSGQGEFGSQYLSVQGQLTIGKDF